MKNMIVLFVVIAVLLLTAACLLVVWRKPGNDRDGSFQRVKHYFGEFDKYRFFVRLPDNHWRRVKSLVENMLETEEGERIPYAEAEAILIVYPNGEIVAEAGNVFSLPEGCRYLEHKKHETDVLDMLRVEEGNRWLSIAFAKSPVGKKDGVTYFSTRITNVSQEPVRVYRFGGYNNVSGKWTLFNGGGAFFDSDQFQSWYGLPEGEEWIRPGESVCDPSNYGGIPMIWAYYFETQSGKKMVAGGLIEKYP